MENNYSKLLVDDKKGSYHNFLTKRHLLAAWLEQKIFQNMTTTRGEKVEVLHPGKWNAAGGSSFTEAKVLIGGGCLTGGIEISLHEGECQDHDDTILRLYYWKEAAPAGNGGTARVCLEDTLTLPPKKLAAAIDLDLYPYEEFAGSGRCAKKIFSGMQEEETRQFLRDAAAWRLTNKRIFLEQQSEKDPRYAVGAGIARSLGSPYNSGPFCDLYFALLTIRELPREQLIAAALAAAGLLEKQEANAYHQSLCDAWRSLEPRWAFRIQLQTGPCRPHNHPIRRAATLAMAAQDPTIPSLFQRVATHWEASWPQMKNSRDWRRLSKELLQLLPDYQDSYWNGRYTFEKKPQSRFLPIIGEATRQRIFVNSLLPFLYESVARDNYEPEVRAFWALYKSLPAEKTARGRYLSHRFFGDSAKSALLKDEETLQGAYQIHQDFCLHYPESCQGCPFIERSKQILLRPS